MAHKPREVHEFTALHDRIAAGKADPITPAQRAAAARIRVAADERFGRETEPWIKKLAEGA